MFFYGRPKYFEWCNLYFFRFYAYELMVLKENIWNNNLFEVPFLGEFAKQFVRVTFNCFLYISAHVCPRGTAELSLDRFFWKSVLQEWLKLAKIESGCSLRHEYVSKVWKKLEEDQQQSECARSTTSCSCVLTSFCWFFQHGDICFRCKL